MQCVAVSENPADPESWALPAESSRWLGRGDERCHTLMDQSSQPVGLWSRWVDEILTSTEKRLLHAAQGVLSS